MAFLKTLFSFFGGGRDACASGDAAAPAATVEYKGFTIRATPYKEAGQYQTAGVIAQEVDGVMKEHKFIRADRYASLDDAVTFTLAKGRQIVDQQEVVRDKKGLFDS